MEVARATASEALPDSEGCFRPRPGNGLMGARRSGLSRLPGYRATSTAGGGTAGTGVACTGAWCLGSKCASPGRTNSMYQSSGCILTENQSSSGERNSCNTRRAALTSMEKHRERERERECENENENGRERERESPREKWEREREKVS